MLFLIQDYEQSKDIYKILIEELKNKSYKHYANSLEFYTYSSILTEEGISGHLSKNDTTELYRNLELAAGIY